MMLFDVIHSVQSSPVFPDQTVFVATGNGKERRTEAELEQAQDIILSSGSISKLKSHSQSHQRPESPSGSSSGGGMLHKMTKSLGTMKDTVVKFAKNDLWKGRIASINEN